MIDIIPAIDIMNGECIRLKQGDFFSKKVYRSDPVAVAREFEGAGITKLHMVDLDGARQKTVVNWKTLKKVADHTSLKIDFGGGIQSRTDLIHVFNCGAHQAVLGSISIRQPEQVFKWIDEFGSQAIIIGMDLEKQKIKISAWQEESDIGIHRFIQNYMQAGIQRIICTDIEKDGMLTGPSFSLYRDLRSVFPELQIVASGGVSTVRDIELLNDIPVDGVIIGKALYEKKITLNQLQKFLC